MNKITEDDFDSIHFKYSESNWLEFKENITSCSANKIIETVCAFLNTGGGSIIIGINDSQKLVGIKSESKKIDQFKLSIDDHISNNSIIYQNDEIILDKYLSMTDVINKNKKKFIIIDIVSQKDKSYKLINGNIFHRLNASNRKIKTIKLMTESNFLFKVEANQKNIISEFNSIIKELNLEINELKEKEKESEDKIIILKNKNKNYKKELIEAYNTVTNICNINYPIPKQIIMH